jgi:hypothetical protein
MPVSPTTDDEDRVSSRIGLVRFGGTASLKIAYVAEPHKRFAPDIASFTLTAKFGI